MSARHQFAFGVIAVAALAVVPLVADGYQLSLGISLLNYAVLATAWALFSGPTRYVSLATSAFFGIGAYTVAVLGEILPWPLVLADCGPSAWWSRCWSASPRCGCSGVYFVIFTFGLAELIRQVVIWYEVNFTRVLGRYVFVADHPGADLLAAARARRDRAGVRLVHPALPARLRAAHHRRRRDRRRPCRHQHDAAKLTLFAVSALFISVTGAVLAPRWTYIEPSIAFNQIMAFQVLIMALLGGAERLYGPLLGVIPLTLLFEWLVGNFPNSYSILLGLSFMLSCMASPTA